MSDRGYIRDACQWSDTWSILRCISVFCMNKIESIIEADKANLFCLS